MRRRSTPDIVSSIDADTAAVLDDGTVLLDVRDYQEWMVGHAPTAVHIPMSELPARVDELDRTQTIVCACRSGSRSARVTGWLCAQGFDARNLTGGMQTWSSFGHPMVDHAGRPGVVI